MQVYLHGLCLLTRKLRLPKARKESTEEKQALADFLGIMDTPKLTLEEILKLTLELSLTFFGVVGNLLVVTLIFKLGKKKQPKDFYFLHLAIADLGTLLFAFPFFAIRKIMSFNWPLGEFTCRYLYPLTEVFFGASVWFIVAIAFRRYRSVVKGTLDLNREKDTRRAKTSIVCVWMVSFVVLCLPLYFIVDYLELPDGGRRCGPTWPSWDHNLVTARVYIGSMALFTYFIPLCLIAFAYISISRALNRTSPFIKTINREPNRNKPNVVTCQSTFKSARLVENKRAQRVLTPLILVFAFTMLPLNVFRLLFVVWPAITEEKYYANILYVISVFVILNSSANPIIYVLVSRNFRKGMRNLCTWYSR